MLRQCFADRCGRLRLAESAPLARGDEALHACQGSSCNAAGHCLQHVDGRRWHCHVFRQSAEGVPPDMGDASKSDEHASDDGPRVQRLVIPCEQRALRRRQVGAACARHLVVLTGKLHAWPTRSIMSREHMARGARLAEQCQQLGMVCHVMGNYSSCAASRIPAQYDTPTHLCSSRSG